MSDDTAARLDDNRAVWDALVGVHVRSEGYDLAGFLRGKDPLGPIEVEAVGCVSGRSVLHVPCHFGLDTLAWARRGARVTGADFSPQAIDVARRIADRVGLDARFVLAEASEVADALGGARFDRVIATWGVLPWMPDLGRWARAMARCVAPGGRFHLVDIHPLAWAFLDPDDPDALPRDPRSDYLSPGVPTTEAVIGTYAGDEAVTGFVQHVWQHDLGTIVTAVASTGLRIVRLDEHPMAPPSAIPALVRGEDGLCRWPDDRPALPLSFSLCAEAPS